MFHHGSMILPTRWAGTEHDGDEGQDWAAGPEWELFISRSVICSLITHPADNQK